jgi:hypothetical protein
MLFSGKWMELENFMLSGWARLKKSKIAYFPSYAKVYTHTYAYI